MLLQKPHHLLFVLPWPYYHCSFSWSDHCSWYTQQSCRDILCVWLSRSLPPFDRLSQLDIIVTVLETEDRMHLIIDYSCRLRGWQLLFNNQTLGDNQTNLLSWVDKAPAGRRRQCKRCRDFSKHDKNSLAPACYGARTLMLHCPASWIANLCF